MRQLKREYIAEKAKEREEHERQKAINDKKRVNHDDKLAGEALQTIQSEYMPIVGRLQKAREQEMKPAKVLFRTIAMQEYICKNLQKSNKDAQNHGIFQGFVEDVKKGSQFYGLARHANDSAIAAQRDKHPTASFIQSCQEEKVLISPSLMQKIRNHTLELLDFRPNDGLCLSLAHAFTLGTKLLQKIVLSGNGLDDPMLATILSGLLHQELFKIFICRRNSIGSNSAIHLSEFFQRKIPKNIDEFRLIECKISSSVIDDLLRGLASSQIRKVALAEANINKSNVGHIFDLVSQSRHLIELDISWNSLSPAIMSRFFEVLSKNRGLENLNLSGNHIQGTNSGESQ